MPTISQDSPGYLYVVEDIRYPGRIRYAGKTSGTVKRRAQGHWSDLKKHRTNSRMHNWLKKRAHQRNLVRFIRWSEHYSLEELNSAEIALIAMLRSIGMADLNITDGGDSNGHEWTESAKKKLKATLAGEGAWKAKLKWGDIHLIRDEYARGVPPRKLAEKWGLSVSAMSKLVRNLTWVDPEYVPPTNAIRGNWLTETSLDADGVMELRKRAAVEDKTYAEWAIEFSVKHAAVRGVLQNKTWVDPNFDPNAVLGASRRRPLRKLTQSDVDEIRKRILLGDRRETLAEAYGVAKSTIKAISMNRTWKSEEWEAVRSKVK